MKKGFTLVELLGVIIVLAVIAIIVFPLVNKTIKTNKEKLYNSQLEEIKSGAEKWAYANIEMLPVNDGESVTITLFELKKGGFLTLDIRNPITGELLPNDMVITITFKNNNFEINVDGNSGSDIDSEVNKNSPIIILNGNFIEYVEINGTYEEKGALAKDKDGNIIQDIQISYQLNGVEIPSIDTKSFNTYTAIYSATSNGYTSRITRTIVVRDTTAPDLIVPGTIELLKEELASFDLLEGVSATDNSGEDIKIETRGFDRLPTDKIIEYTACDSHNNCVTKRRLVKIVREDTEEDTFTMEPVEFEYTGAEQNFTVPHSGYYKLEVWGAQGGNYTGSLSASGGKGGYTSLDVYLSENDIIYINVGGQGGNSSNGVGGAGYNGGGVSSVSGCCSSATAAGGGGATHMALTSGFLSTLENNRSSILLVAGGGGGAGYYPGCDGWGNRSSAGSAAGDLAGINEFGGSQLCPSGDSSNRNYFPFGKGNSASTCSGGAGGGGYCGGAIRGYGYGGGGGSGYVSDTSGKVLSGQSEMPSHDGIGTMIGNVGNGYAKITYIGQSIE